MKNLETWESKTLRPGQRYGRYVILTLWRKIGTYQYFGLCQCDCGSPQRYVSTVVLRNGTAQSCGCLHKERVTKHGAWGTPLFRAWSSMMDRCTNPKTKRYPRYGGRGITVCERWRDVHQFIADMGPTFKKGLRIERINNDVGYSPENCRWATAAEQNRNYSRNVMITHQGETLCLTDWAIKIGMNYGTLWDRIKQGWSTERALTTPTLSSQFKGKNTL